MANFLDAAGDDLFARFEAARDLDLAGEALTHLHLAALRAALADDEEVLSAALGDEDFLRNDDGVLALGQRQLDVEEHARLERVVRILEDRVDAHRARGGVDTRVDDADRALEGTVHEGRCARDHAEARPELAEVVFRDREIQLDLRQIVERRHHGAGLHQCAKADLAHADATVERRRDAIVIEPRIHRAQLRLVGADTALGGAELRFQLVESRLGDVAAALELLRAIEALLDLVALRLRLFEIGARLIDIGAALLRLELDQHRARAHVLALREIDLVDIACLLGSDGHGLIGARGADRFRDLADRAGTRRNDLHRNRRGGTCRIGRGPAASPLLRGIPPAGAEGAEPCNHKYLNPNAHFCLPASRSHPPQSRGDGLTPYLAFVFKGSPCAPRVRRRRIITG